MDLPHFFPSDINRRLAGLGQNPRKKKFNVVFQDFGRCGHVDVKYSDSEISQSQTKFILTQKQHQKQPDRATLCACIPTIPLSQTPTEVHYPLQDGVIGDLPDLPGRVIRFSRGLAQVSASLRNGVKWKEGFLRAKGTLEEELPGDGRPSDAVVDAMVAEDLPASISNLAGMHEDLRRQSSFRVYNSRYSGGLLSCVQGNAGGESTGHLLFHARGRDLDRLALTVARPSDSRLVPSRLVAEERVGRVFQVDATAVQGDVFVATRHETSCCVFSVPKAQCMDVPVAVSGGSDADERSTYSTGRVSQPRVSPECSSVISSENVLQFNPLGRCDFDEGKAPTSVCMSPYLPGEGLFCGESGVVKLWSARQGGVVSQTEREARFRCRDAWCQAYYAGHPRHVVVADRTAVQMMDHRDGFRGSVDLFSLPSRLVHQEECVMAARGHSSGAGPLHVVATSHCVFVVDQRFGGSPVMSWYPDLEGPVQYLASTNYEAADAGDGGGGGAAVVLVGSQHPAEVMCYPFSGGVSVSVTTSLNPWRLSPVSDIGDPQRYGCFHGAVDPLLLEERVGLSLAGMAVARGRGLNSILTYQADCYGELFYQGYAAPRDPRTAVKTGVPPPGKRDHHVPPDVQAHVSSWLERLNQQVVSLTSAARRKRREKEEVWRRQRVPDCRRWLFEACGAEKDRSAEPTRERCSLCGNLVDDVSNVRRLDSLCGSCRDFHQGRVSVRHRQPRSLLSQQSSHSAAWSDTTGAGDADSGGGGHALGRVREGLNLLDAQVPRVNGYEADAFTSVHLELMKPDPQVLDLVRKREEERAALLEDLKSKNRRLRERKGGKKRPAEEDSVDAAAAAEDTGTAAQHSVFNTAEHQQQNSRIDAILSNLTKRTKTTTISGDASFSVSAMYGDSDYEVLPLNDVPGEMSFDLFHNDSGEEETKPQPQNVSQDDDDEFFGSQDLFAPVSAASGALNVSQSPVPASPVVTDAHSLEWGNRNTLSLPDSKDFFVTSSQKDSQSLHVGHRPSPAQKSHSFFSPSVSPVSVFSRVKAPGPSQSSVHWSSGKRSLRRANSKNNSISSLQDLSNLGSPRVADRSLTLAVDDSEPWDVTMVAGTAPDTQPSFSPGHTSPFLNPRSFNLRTPDKNAGTLSPLTLSSEKRKSKSVKKHKFSLGGFC